MPRLTCSSPWEFLPIFSTFFSSSFLNVAFRKFTRRRIQSIILDKLSVQSRGQVEKILHRTFSMVISSRFNAQKLEFSSNDFKLSDWLKIKSLCKVVDSGYRTTQLIPNNAKISALTKSCQKCSLSVINHAVHQHICIFSCYFNLLFLNVKLLLSEPKEIWISASSSARIQDHADLAGRNVCVSM